MARSRIVFLAAAWVLGGTAFCWHRTVGQGPGTAFAQQPQSGPVASQPATAGAPDLDARYVSMEVPEAVLAGEVFQVKITMKNTGALAWKEVWRQQGTETILLSQGPEGDQTWGTGYIIQGQGTVVEPGKEFTFRSSLRAPAEAGQYPFQWRLKAGGEAFGEPTARRILTVRPRDATPRWATTLPAGEDGQRPLTFDDFQYVGSFKIPPKAGDGGAGFSDVGMALRKMPDGRRRLFLNYTHPAQSLAEVEVPEPVRLRDAADLAALKVPEIKKVWGPVRMTVPKVGDVTGIAPNGGLFWDEETRTLYWSWHHWYWTGGALPVLGACKLADDGTISCLGPWSAPNIKYYWGGVIRLPKAFARKYTGGRTLALGFGGYYNVCGPCSRGPSLGAIADPDPGKQEVDLLALLNYAGPAKAPRDGDYFSANCGFWHDPPDGPLKGYWAAFDECRSGVFVDLPDGHAYVTFARLSTGRIGYDYGAGTSAGTAQYWYFYNPPDLGAVAKGARKPGEVMPYLMVKDGPKAAGPAVVGGTVTGSCFDPEQRRLYVVRVWAYAVGRENHPLIHVYQVKEAPGATGS